MNKPLVSLTVICYQAESFIREAINGALSQTYSPMEVIFSDDASNDRTFDIIREYTAGYSGPHKIVLNRNAENMGIGAHVSKVWFDIAKGDWIIVSAGDDISLPHRVERLMEVANPEIGAIHHNCIAFNGSSHELPPAIDPIHAYEDCKKTVDELLVSGGSLLGSTMCLNRRMLEKYGRINADVVNEDNVLMYRARHFGGFIFLNEPLLKYRIHRDSVTNQFVGNSLRDYMGQIVRNSKNRIAVINQIFADARLIPLSKEVMDSLKSEKEKLAIDVFLFSDGRFDSSYLLNVWFYIKLIKKAFFRIYWRIRKLHYVSDYFKK